ncbi:MAG: guanylate kinase [Lachnospiraceae bacterium]
MGKIFYLMGKSSSGKDTIYKHLLQSRGINLKSIIPHTTRPIRDGEKHGVDYYFTDEKELEELQNKGKIIELREYNTFYGTWKYFTVDDEQIDLNTNDYILVGTLDSFQAIKEYLGENNVIPILIELDDGERLQRALNREKQQKIPKYEEMCRRFLADSSDFSDQRLKEVGIIKKFNNDDLGNCLERIKEYIQSF